MPLYFHPVLFFFLSSSFSSPILSLYRFGRLPYFHKYSGLLGGHNNIKRGLELFMCPQSCICKEI